MANKTVRRKTKTPGIYYNEGTECYDLKYNYKEYNPKTGKNDYKAKWYMGFEKIADAKTKAAELKGANEEPEKEDEAITVEGAYELWKIKAKANNLSKATLKNTECYMKMLYKVIPKETRMKDLDEELYFDLITKSREAGYSEETLHNINSTFRKLCNLVYKKRLLKENPLNFIDGVQIKIVKKDQVIKVDQWEEIDRYFKETSFVRKGVDVYRKHRFLVNLLYFTGLRISEAIALTYEDWQEYDYHRKRDEKKIRLVPADSTEEKHMRGMIINIDKSFDAVGKEMKLTKNYKNRQVPVPPSLERMFLIDKNNHLENGGKLTDRIFDFSHGNANGMIKKCGEKLGLPKMSCHTFRHTYISNLISAGVPLPVVAKVSGDEMETLIKRYIHLIESDIYLVIKAMKDLIA